MSELSQLNAHLGVSTLIQVDENFLAEMQDDGNPISLGGSGRRTVWNKEQGVIEKRSGTKLVCAPGGHILLTPRFLAGECALCLEEHRRTVLTQATARQCADCSKLVCESHRKEVSGSFYCSNHARRARIRQIWRIIIG